MTQKSKALRKLADQYVGPGTIVKMNAPQDSKQSKFNGSKGRIEELNCDYNPIAIVQLDNGPELAVELRYLIYPKQGSLL